MLLFPFGFQASSGPTLSLPVNTVAPSVIVINEADKIVQYTAGTWTGADSVTFAWYMDDVEQIGENSNTFIATYNQDVKVTESATNGAGTVNLDSNVVNIPAPPYYELGTVDWSFSGSLATSQFEGAPATDTGTLNWTLAGIANESEPAMTDTGDITWEVFGSVVT